MTKTKVATLQPDSGVPRALGRAARTGVMWAYVRTSIYALVSLPATIVLARLLSPAEFGIAAAATFFGRLASRLSSAGMGIALVRIKDLREDHISSVFVVNTVMATIAGGTLIAAAPYIAAFYQTPEVGYVLPLVALDFALGALSMVSQALLTRAMRYKDMAALGSAEMATMSFASVAFAASGFGYTSLVLGAVCGSAVKWLWGVKMAGWHLRFKFVPSAARELTSFALGTYTNGLLEHLSLNLDNLVIGRVLGVDALGLYDKAFSIVNRLYRHLTVVGPSVSFRAFAIMQDEPERFRRAYHKIILTVTLVGYVAFAALGTMGPHLIVVVFGEKWRPSVIPFQLLCVSGAFRILNVYASTAANARGWVWSTVWRQIIQLTCIVVGVYLAAPWGINGGSTAVVGAMIVMFFLLQNMMQKATGLGWGDLLQPQIPALSASAAIVAMLWGIDVFMTRSAVIANPIVVLGVQGVAASVFCAAFVWWCPFPEARTVIHDILNDVSPRLARAIARRPDDGRTPSGHDTAQSVKPLPACKAVGQAR